jgi:dTDP-4-amino-4,6-dideoxygalactose transaminase
MTDTASTVARLSGSAPLPWSQPVLGEEEIAEVVDTLRSGWLTTGPKAARFEAEVASRLGVERAFAVTSCTAALHLALLVTGVGPGDEVISPSLTFCAAVNVIAHCGALPVLVDVEPETLNVDPEAVEAAVTPRTRAIIAMHYAGQPCDMDSLGAIARRNGLVLIEDAAHALGATYRGRPAGTLGDLAAFSFYSNKNMTTGEGGMLVGGRELVERARLLGRHGIDRSPWDRHGNRAPVAYDVVEPGLKYNMSDIAASIGIHQLARLEAFNRRRRTIAERYSSALAQLRGLRVPRPAQDWLNFLRSPPA